IVYLADGEYKKKLVKNSLNLSPYVIDDREDFMADQTRNKFMIEFLNTFYRFGAVKTVDDSEIRINME
ncbi:MAG TPA: hypothetical protein VEB40_08510, partial [Flavipsychrobacter sp.]|nr:hypothetical protein [Flavipsychrobacter sp.]